MIVASIVMLLSGLILDLPGFLAAAIIMPYVGLLAWGSTSQKKFDKWGGWLIVAILIPAVTSAAMEIWVGNGFIFIILLLLLFGMWCAALNGVRFR